MRQQNGDVVQKYECRLRKSQKGSKPPPPKDGVKKRYGSTVPGLEAGEQEVSHLLCTVHTMRTLNKRFKSASDKSVFNALRNATYTHTRTKRTDLREEATPPARDEKTKNYIRTYWLETSQKWAGYAFA